MDWGEIRRSRRRLEEIIRGDLADLEHRWPENPEVLEDIEITLRATIEFWRGEIQDINPKI